MLYNEMKQIGKNLPIHLNVVVTTSKGTESKAIFKICDTLWKEPTQIALILLFFFVFYSNSRYDLSTFQSIDTIERENKNEKTEFHCFFVVVLTYKGVEVHARYTRERKILLHSRGEGSRWVTRAGR